MLTDVKEVNKKLKLAMKIFKDAVQTVKDNMVVYTINPPTEKKVRAPRKVRVVRESTAKKPKEIHYHAFTSEPEKDLPDLDKGGYMNKRSKNIAEQPATEEK